MSGGKKKNKYKKRTYTQGEFVRAVRKSTDDATKRIILLCVCAAQEEFSLDEEGTVGFTQRMMRYCEYYEEHLIKMKDASESLWKNAGIDLRLTGGN